MNATTALSNMMTNLLNYCSDKINSASKAIKDETIIGSFDDGNSVNALMSVVAEEVVTIAVANISEAIKAETEELISGLNDNINKELASNNVDIKHFDWTKFFSSISNIMSFADFKNYTAIVGILETVKNKYCDIGKKFVEMSLDTNVLYYSILNPMSSSKALKLVIEKIVSSGSDFMDSKKNTEFEKMEENLNSAITTISSAFWKYYDTGEEGITDESKKDIIKQEISSAYYDKMFKFYVFCKSLNPMFDEKMIVINNEYQNDLSLVKSYYFDTVFKTKETRGQTKDVLLKKYNESKKTTVSKAKEFNKLFKEALDYPTPYTFIKNILSDKVQSIIDFQLELESISESLKTQSDSLDTIGITEFGDVSDEDLDKFVEISVLMKDIILSLPSYRIKLLELESEDKKNIEIEVEDYTYYKVNFKTGENNAKKTVKLYEVYERLEYLVSSIKDLSSEKYISTNTKMQSLIFKSMSSILKSIDKFKLISMVSNMIYTENPGRYTTDKSTAIKQIEKELYAEDGAKTVMKEFDQAIFRKISTALTLATSLDGLTSDEFEREVVTIVADLLYVVYVPIQTLFCVEQLSLQAEIVALETITVAFKKIGKLLESIAKSMDDVFAFAAGVASLFKNPAGTFSSVATLIEEAIRRQFLFAKKQTNDAPKEITKASKDDARARLLKTKQMIANLKAVIKKIQKYK